MPRNIIKGAIYVTFEETKKLRGIKFLYTPPDSPPPRKSTWGCLWTVLVSVC